MDLQLSGKTVVITGASRGLGRAMALAFAHEGARLSVCARGSETLDDAVRDLKAAGAEVLGEALDVTDRAAIERWVGRTAERFGGIDVLVNNAGAAAPGGLAQLSDKQWLEAFDLNFFAPVALARLCAPWMEKSGGTIVNISSIYGREAGGPLTYNASKAALNSFTKTLSREMAAKGIRVNTVAPGSIIYPGGQWEKRFKANPAFEKDFIGHELPAGRLGRPEEVAYAVVCLASPRASWINGVCLPVDGSQGRSNI